MKAKHLSLAAVLLAAGGLWLARSAWRTHLSEKSTIAVSSKMPRAGNADANSDTSLPAAFRTEPTAGPNNRTTPRQMLRPPEPNRRFADFTPEQRVEFARKGHGPGG